MKTRIHASDLALLLLLAAALGAAGCSSCPTGQLLCKNQCVDLFRDPQNCGACGMACQPGNSCSQGQCVLNCPMGFTSCGGACRDLQGDRANCGTCGNACAAEQVCAAGACASSCPKDFTACNGACRDLNVDPANCGACGKACAGGQSCVAGLCALVCPPGLTACNGACRDLNADPANCGACAKTCPQGQVCGMGRCAVVCPFGQTDCNGACRDLNGDNANCGACDAACMPGQVCAMGKCALTCQPDLTICNGTCRDLKTDNANCGACGTACMPGQVCSMGRCAVSCQVNLTNCNGACRDLTTDNANCGACAKACAQGEVCVAGKCTLQCPNGFTNCNGRCVSLQTDAANCGACGMACAQGQVCASGACASNCAMPLVACGNACVDPRFDTGNCGGCGKQCAAPANGTAACVAAACKAICNAGFGDCDANYANGCEADLRADAKNCGLCGTACPMGQPCVSGQCTSVLASCRAIKQANPNAASGLYTIDPDGAGAIAPYPAYCDMTTSSGGWTLIVNRITASDNNGQPDLNANAGTFDNARATNWTYNLTPFYAASTEYVFAVKHNGNCANCTIAQYDAAILAPRSAGNTFSVACPAIEAVTATKIVGPTPGPAMAYRCTGSLGWGSCNGNVCHWGLHGMNTSSDGSWSQNTAQEMHFPSAYSSYRSYTNAGGYCRSCGGGLTPGMYNPLSSTCCNQPNSPDSSTWTIWVR